MEYAIGKILYIRESGARVQALFYSKNEFWTHHGIEAVFPPSGKVFAPNLPFDYPSLKENDIIRFNYVENEFESRRDDHDDFIIPRKKEGGTVLRCPQIFDVTADDIFNRKAVADSKELCFFFRKQGATSYICGSVWSSDLSPRIGKEVKAWKYRANYDTITDPSSGGVFLAVDKDEFMRKDFAFEVDCMSPSQLKDWLKEKLSNALPPDALRPIKEKIKELASRDENDPLTKERFARVRHSLNAISFDWSEIQSIRALPGFKDLINESIQAQIDAVMETEKASIKKRREEIKIEQERLELDFAKAKKHHESEKTKLTTALEKLEKQIKEQHQAFTSQEEQYKKLLAKRDDLIESIKIQAEIIGFRSSQHNASSPYPLEFIIRKQDANKVSSDTKEAFCDRVNESLELQRGFMRSSLRKLSDRLVFKTADIRTGIFLASVLGNSVYQLCQPSPRWISFKEFWEESLQNIWDSAHVNPDVWHFLLIENFNIALPECWGRPLWNIIMQKTKNIPYASKTCYPHNLRIIVSLAETDSEDNSHTGLPTHISDSWSELNVSESWDDKDNWQQFVEDMENGLAVNEEYYYPVVL